MNSLIYIKFRINFSTLANMLAANSLRIPQVTVPRRCFFCGSYSLFFFSLFHTAMSVFAVLWSHVGKRLTSWLCCMWLFIVFSSLSHTMFWVRFCTWLYRFLIFAFFLSLFRISALGELISVNIFKKSYLPCLLRQRYNQFKIKTYSSYEYTTLSK